VTKDSQKFKLPRGRRRLRYAGRKLLAAAVLAAVAAGLVAADRLGIFGRAPKPDAEKYDGGSFCVARVIDGDTIDLDVPDGRHGTTRVRLWGVDTPETHKDGERPQHFGPEATAATKRLCGGKTVKIKLEAGAKPRDRYGRLLAWVYLNDGRLLNRVLVEDGFAYADPRFGHHLKRQFRSLQDEAMRAGRGLWENVTDADLPYYYKGKLKLPHAASVPAGAAP